MTVSLVSYSSRSNCHTDTARQLRKNYKRPHFLPEGSESSRLDWIFIGWPGPGAFLHVSSQFTQLLDAPTYNGKYLKTAVPDSADMLKESINLYIYLI